MAQHKQDTNNKSDIVTNAQKVNPFDPNTQINVIKDDKNPLSIHDSTSDANKITNSIVHGLLTGGTGAVVGVITSNSGDMGTDVITASSSAMQQKAPQIVDPVVQQIENAQKSVRQQNHIDNVNNVKQVINNQNKYSNKGDFISALYHSLNPSDQHSLPPSLSNDQMNAIHQIIDGKASDEVKANSINQIFIWAKNTTTSKK